MHTAISVLNLMGILHSVSWRNFIGIVIEIEPGIVSLQRPDTSMGGGEIQLSTTALH